MRVRGAQAAAVVGPRAWSQRAAGVSLPLYSAAVFLLRYPLFPFQQVEEPFSESVDYKISLFPLHQLVFLVSFTS